MRIGIFILCMVFSPMLAVADVEWHQFGDTREKQTIRFDRVSVSVEVEDKPNAPFPGDDLLLTLQASGQKTQKYYFNSSYGHGAIAVSGDILLIKYGVGRGTWEREEHVKALWLGHDLTELVDVQSSSYVLTDLHNAAPDLFEYQLNIQTSDGYTTLIFKLPKPQHGIPSEKIVRIKNDA